LRILEWFRDRAIRKVVRFGLPVAAGKAVGSLTSLVTLALLAHHLDLRTFGVIALIRTTVMVIDQYANFNTWQAIVKYGTEAIAAGRRDDVRGVIKLAFVIDLATGVIGAIVAAGLALVIPAAFDWTPHEARMCVLYAITLVVRAAGASDGIYRICDAYRAQAITTSIAAILIAGAVAIAVALDASFTGIIIALIIGESVGNLLIMIGSWYVARQQDFGGWWGASLRGIRTRLPGIVHFLLATNAQLTVRKTQAELDMFVVGAMLGNAASGLFRVVKQLGTIPGRIFMPFEQVIFTELSRAAAAGDYAGFQRLLRRSAGILALGSLVIWLVAAAVAEPVIEVIAGADYVAAADAFRWYLLAMVIMVANAPVQRAMIALGRPGTLFLFELGTLIVLVATTLVGAQQWGLVGVSAAIVLNKALQVVWSTWLVGRVIRTRQQTAPAVESAS
jgi:O-antigen/teichoic acid export membrane protein